MSASSALCRASVLHGRSADQWAGDCTAAATIPVFTSDVIGHLVPPFKLHPPSVDKTGCQLEFKYVPFHPYEINDCLGSSVSNCKPIESRDVFAFLVAGLFTLFGLAGCGSGGNDESNGATSLQSGVQAVQANST